MPTLADMGHSATNFSTKTNLSMPKTDCSKIMCAVTVVVIMGIYCGFGFWKHLKFQKMLEKAAGKGGAAALRDKLLPDDLRKKLGDVSGFPWLKALMTFFLSLGFVFTMVLLP